MRLAWLRLGRMCWRTIVRIERTILWLCGTVMWSTSLWRTRAIGESSGLFGSELSCRIKLPNDELPNDKLSVSKLSIELHRSVGCKLWRRSLLATSSASTFGTHHGCRAATARRADIGSNIDADYGSVR